MISEAVLTTQRVSPCGSPKSTDFMHARYFSSNLGRFLSVDPVGGNVGSSQSWNRYSYVHNNPLASIDPTGALTKVLLGGHTEDNVFGHVAVSVNGVVYSYGTNRTQGPNKDWGASEDQYLAAQEGERETQVIELSISEEQEAALSTYLGQNDPNAAGAPAYDVLDNSCVTVQEKAFESVGVLSNEPGPVTVNQRGDLLQAGAQKSLTPSGLVQQLDSAGVTGRATTVGNEKVSYLRSAANTLLDQLGF